MSQITPWNGCELKRLPRWLWLRGFARRHGAGLLVALIATHSCSTPEANSLQRTVVRVRDQANARFLDSFRLVKELRFPDSGPHAVGSIRSLDIDQKGRLLVADSKGQNLKLYDSEGRVLRIIGRQGRGPGEFELPIAARFGSAGELFAIDASLARVTVFDSTGHYMRSFSTVGQDPRDMLILHDGRILVVGLTEFRRKNHLLAIYDGDGSRRSFHAINPVVLSLDLLVDNAWAAWLSDESFIAGSNIAFEAHEYSQAGSRLRSLPPETAPPNWRQLHPASRPKEKSLKLLSEWIGRASVVRGGGTVNGVSYLAFAPKSSEEVTELLALSPAMTIQAQFAGAPGRFVHAGHGLLALVQSEAESQVILRLFARNVP